MQRGKEMAKLYNDTAPGARAGQAPALKRTMPDGSTRFVKFDGIDGDYPIDRKWSIYRTQKAKEQALRQSAALAEKGSEEYGSYQLKQSGQKRSYF